MDLNRLKNNTGSDTSPLAPGGDFSGAVSTTRSLFDPTEAVTKAFLDNLTPPGSGSISVDLTLYLDKLGTHHMSGKITVPGDPTAANQMVNKHYVVTQIDSAAAVALQASQTAAVSSAVAYIESQLQSSLLPGTIVEWDSETPPAGFLRTNGAVLLQADFPDLYAEVGSSFNASGASGVQFVLSKYLFGPGTVAFGYYGKSVAFNATGTVMAVGMDRWTASSTNQGGVCLYDWTGGNWVQRGGVLVAPDAADGDSFGSSVALNSDGTVLVVGAPLWEGAASNQGGVYIFDWTGGAWVQRGSVLEAADAAANAFFGGSVALNAAGTVLVVGAQNWTGTFSWQGAVYIYDWSGSAWVQRGTILTEPTPADNNGFGVSVAISGDGTVLSVGSLSWSGTYAYQGGVYVYDVDVSSWAIRGSVLVAPDAAANDYFGIAMALNGIGDVLVVGATLWEGAVTDQGGVYIFDWNGMAWVQRGAVLSAPSGQSSANFGSALAITASGNMLAIGESGRAVSSNADSGEIRTYNTPTTPVPTVPAGSFSLPNTVPEETILNNGVFNIIKT